MICYSPLQWMCIFNVGLIRRPLKGGAQDWCSGPSKPTDMSPGEVALDFDVGVYFYATSFVHEIA